MSISIKIPGANFSKVIARYRRAVRFSALSNLVESGNAGTGYTYSNTGVGYARLASLKLAANVDGWFATPIVIGGGGVPVLSVDVSNSTISGSPVVWGKYGVYSFVGGNYRVIVDGAGNQTAQVTRAYLVGDIMRIRRAGGILIAEVSSDGGETFGAVHTFLSTYTGVLYPGLVDVGTAGSVDGPVAASDSAAVV